jgi:dTDP-4-amino-4,6-dideoxy-D-galactose acyltransferase
LTELSSLEQLPTCAEFAITEVPPGPASEALTALAVEAGSFSRFGVDPHIPRERFVALYRQWMERSTRRELAETVLAACRPEEPDVPLGMVTLALNRGEGVTGLIAVHKAARGRGIGARLLAADHDIRRQRGVSEMSVATQLANESACRLYRHAGYRLAEVNNMYHFWPQRAKVTTRDAAAA